MVDEINTNLDTTPLPPNILVAKDPQSAEIAGYVRTKTFGREVREAIARSIELNSTRSKNAESLANETLAVTKTATSNMANQVELIKAEKDTIIANVTQDSEVQIARGGKATLGERLDETDAQLAQTVTNIMDFGAIGDGVTDDTLAIQKALDTGGNVMIPNKHFIITDSLYVRTNGQKIFGNGKTTAIVEQKNTQKSAFVFEVANDVKISDFQIKGNVNTITNRTAGIDVIEWVRGFAENMYIRGFAFNVSYENATQGWIADISNSNIEGALLAGVYLPKNAHAVTMRANEIRASKYGVVIGRILADGNIDDDYNENGAGSVSIESNTIEGNRDYDVVIANGIFSPNINYNYFETAVKQDKKKAVIRYGSKFKADGVTLATGRVIGGSIIGYYNYTHPTYATDFPVIKLGRFSYLAIRDNNSLSLNQVLVDTTAIGGSGNIEFENNFANGGKITSGVTDGVSLSSDYRPMSRNDGSYKNYYQWDSETSSFRIGMSIANRYRDGVNLRSKFTSSSETRLEGVLSVPSKTLNAKAMGIIGGGTITINKNLGKVIMTEEVLILMFATDITTSSSGQVLKYIDNYMPSSKKLAKLGDGHVVGTLWNGSEELKVITRGENIAIETTTAGNYKLSGTIIIPLENV